MTSLYFSAG